MSSRKAGQDGVSASPNKSGDCFHFHLLLDRVVSFFSPRLRGGLQNSGFYGCRAVAHPAPLQPRGNWAPPGDEASQHRENCPLWALLLRLGDRLGGGGTFLWGSWSCTPGSEYCGGKMFHYPPQKSQTCRRCGLYVLLTPRRSCECVTATDWVLFQPHKRLPEILKTPAETQIQTLNE